MTSETRLAWPKVVVKKRVVCVYISTLLGGEIGIKNANNVLEFKPFEMGLQICPEIQKKEIVRRNSQVFRADFS